MLTIRSIKIDFLFSTLRTSKPVYVMPLFPLGFVTHYFHDLGSGDKLIRIRCKPLGYVVLRRGWTLTLITVFSIRRTYLGRETRSDRLTGRSSDFRRSGGAEKATEG